MRRSFTRFTRFRDERGSAMAEYALILALVTLLGIAGLSAVGDASVSLYSGIGDAFEAIFG
jgi:Flp pilus assembly pilin Flp